MWLQIADNGFRPERRPVGGYAGHSAVPSGADRRGPR